MAHIRQINSSKKANEAYTVVITSEEEILKDHPSIVEHPELFEIVEDEIPDDAQYLNYSA